MSAYSIQYFPFIYYASAGESQRALQTSFNMHVMKMLSTRARSISGLGVLLETFVGCR